MILQKYYQNLEYLDIWGCEKNELKIDLDKVLANLRKLKRKIHRWQTLPKKLNEKVKVGEQQKRKEKLKNSLAVINCK